MKPRLFFTIIILNLLVFWGCKKDISCENCPDGNRPPIAVAGSDQVISLPTDSVLLDGSASSDPDGNISRYLWKKISGPASFIIVNPSESKTIGRNLVAGIYRFELTITDNGNLSARDTVQITVADPGMPNRSPVANAGPDQTIILPTTTVTLNAGASTDPDNNIISYEWSKISGPPYYNFTYGSLVLVQVTNLALGEYLFELKVTDAGGLIDRDTVRVMVSASAVDIYVAGQMNGLPVYWKNGQAITLGSDQWGFYGSSITVVGSDIYVAATRNELWWNDYAAKYWINGQEVTLGNYAGATSIAVDGNDVYVAGWEWDYTHIGAVAKYWKNGQEVPLTDGNTEAYAYSIVVAGADIYVAGEEGGVAKYWKNGLAVSLSAGVARSMVVVGSDIYVAGYENGLAKYWKNGQAVSLTPGTATSIAVADNDVYVAGYTYIGQGNSVAKYWKNGQEVRLTNGSEALAGTIAIFGSDVYIAGTEKIGFTYTAKYWKNGQPVQLATGAGASSIVVVNH